MIHEKGAVQLIDFGVAGAIGPNLTDKRATIIGTAHWMAPEMHQRSGSDGIEYGPEVSSLANMKNSCLGISADNSDKVDIWSYGATLVEMATGAPPKANLRIDGRGGPSFFASEMYRDPPKLNRAHFSQPLCELVEFVCNPDRNQRPSMEEVLEHHCFKDTEVSHPTESLANLVRIFQDWEQNGGERMSLYAPGGAEAPKFAVSREPAVEEDWRFSTMLDFSEDLKNLNFAAIPDTPEGSHNDFVQARGFALNDSATHSFDSYPSPTPDISDAYLSSFNNMSDQGVDTPTQAIIMSSEANAKEEERVRRGGETLGAVFKPVLVDDGPSDIGVESNLTAGDGKHPAMNRASSDLPLRNATAESSIRRKELDPASTKSASYTNLPNINLSNVDSIKAQRLAKDKQAATEWKMPTEASSAADFGKRQTMEWKFPSFPANEEGEPEMPPVRPALTHSETAPAAPYPTEGAASVDPIGASGRPATLDIDALMNDSELSSGERSFLSHGDKADEYWDMGQSGEIETGVTSPSSNYLPPTVETPEMSDEDGYDHEHNLDDGYEAEGYDVGGGPGPVEAAVKGAMGGAGGEQEAYEGDGEESDESGPVLR